MSTVSMPQEKMSAAVTASEQAPTTPANVTGKSPYAQRAYFYIEMGYSVIPIAPGSKRPGSWTAEHGWRGMHDWEKFNTRLPTAVEVEIWSTWPDAGIGLLTGKLSGITGLDRDYDAKGTDALEQMIPFTPVKKRGQKGYTAFFRYNGERSCSFNIDGKRVLDVLSDGRQTLMPGTVHPDGPTYIYLTEDLLETFDPKTLPVLSDDFLDRVATLLAQYQTDQDKRYQKKNLAFPAGDSPLKVERTVAQQYYADLNQAALAQLSAWVPKLIPGALVERAGYRSIATWRAAELPNVGIHPSGIFDFGGNYGMSALTLIMNANAVPFFKAAEMLCMCITLNDPEPIVFDGDVVAAAVAPVLSAAAIVSYTTPVPFTASNDRGQAGVAGTELLAASELVEQPAPCRRTEDQPAFPQHLLKPPGVLLEFMEWILCCAQKPQPILALVTALSIVATVLAQKVKSHTGLRTNLYLVSVADTSAGKDHGRKCLKVAFQAAGLENMLGGEELVSGSGLLAGVKRQPCAVFQLDEFGLLLKSIRSKNSGAHLQQIVTNLMKLFTSAGSIYTGAEYADQNKRARADIAYPCVNVHGTTTPEPLFEAFGSGDVASGNLNRLLILFAPTSRFPLRHVDIVEPPATLVDWMKAARNLHQQELVGIMPDNPIRIPMSGGAERLFENLYEYQQDQEQSRQGQGLHYLWGRCLEHASKVALVIACAKHADAKEFAAAIERGEVVVDEESARWAIDFVKHVLGRMEHEVSSRVADSEFGQLKLMIQGRIKNAGPKGLTERELVRACARYAGLPPIQRDAVMGALIRDEAIVLVELKSDSGRGRSRSAFVWHEYREDADIEVAAGP